MNLNRREWIGRFTSAFICAYSRPLLVAGEQSLSIRGLVQAGKDPVLVMQDGRRVHLESDAQNMLVLGDERLNHSDVEAHGHWIEPDRFAVDPIYMRALAVYKEGKRLMITYWCDVCYIRTYSPGKCWCCQKYTDLDLRESDNP